MDHLKMIDRPIRPCKHQSLPPCTRLEPFDEERPTTESVAAWFGKLDNSDLKMFKP